MNPLVRLEFTEMISAMLVTEFLPWDDHEVIVDNPVVREGISFSSFFEAFQEVTLNLWTPVTLWSHQLDVTLFQMNAGGHHVMSLLYHLLAGLVLWWALVEFPRPLSKTSVRLWVVGLFLCHPMHVESWAWISERKDTLSAIFAFLSLGYWARWLKKRGSRWYLLSLGAFTLGLMSKPSLVTWPAVLFMTMWGVDFFSHEGAVKRVVKALIPFGVLSMAVILLTWWVQMGREEMAIIETAGIQQRLMTGIANYGVYLFRFIWPLDLAYFYPLPTEMPVGRFALGLCSLALLSYVAWCRRHDSPWYLWGWVLFMVIVFPTVGFVVSGESNAPDRYSYLSYTGLFVMTGCFLEKHLSVMRQNLLTVALCGVCGVLSLRQAMTWRTMETLTKHALSIDPENYKAHFALARELEQKGKGQEAQEHLRRCAELRPSHGEAQMRLGNLAITQKAYEEAERRFRMVRKYWAHSPLGLDGLGAALAYQEKWEEAQEVYQLLLSQEPHHRSAKNNIELCLRKITAMRRSPQEKAPSLN